MQRLLPMRLPLIVTLFAVVLYISLTISVHSLTARIHWTFWLTAAFLSPVAVAYPFVSTAGYHKEIIFLAVLGAMLARLLHLRRSHRSISWMDGLLLAAVSVAGVLSHELFAIYFPYMLAALYFGERDWRRVTRIAALPIIAVGIAFYAAATNAGTPALAQTVCTSLGPQNHSMCGGSIAYLASTREAARADTIATVREWHSLDYLPLLTLLGVLPIAAAYWELRNHPIPTADWIALLAGFTGSVLLSVSLFLYGADWGRWLEIHLFSLFLLLLFLAALYRKSSAPVLSGNTWIAFCQCSLLLIFATCWSLPGETAIPKGGYVSMVARITARMVHHKPQ